MSQYPYDLGDVARITVSFTQGGAPVDPATVQFEVLTPADAVDLILYAGSPLDEIVRDDVGEYHIDLSLDSIGTYTYRWVTTGTAQAAIYGSFRVPSFVSLQQAKDHIRDTSAAGASGDADLLLKLDAAEAIILDYIGSTAYWQTVRDAWTNATVPSFVRSAILLQFSELCRFRGDDESGHVPLRDAVQDLSPAIVALLRRTRDPVVQ